MQYLNQSAKGVVVVRIAFVGPSKSGKTFAADLCLKKWGGIRASFATPVKQEVFTFLQDFRKHVGSMKIMDLYPKAYGKEDRPNVGYMSLPPLSDTVDPVAWINAHKAEVRPLLQWWGTEYRRSENPNHWINLMKPILAENEDVYVDDCRFMNEADFLLRNDFSLIGLTPPVLAENVNQNHASEKEVYDIWGKYEIPVIANDKVSAEKLEEGILASLAL